MMLSQHSSLLLSQPEKAARRLDERPADDAPYPENSLIA
jgi:hypothetical protein